MWSNIRVYSVYGFQPSQSSHGSQVGFNGEMLDGHAGIYLLGKGYRGYSPVLMRFIAPDSWSPFGAGGLNTYAYCAGDPVTRSDPSGHVDIGSRNLASVSLLANSRRVMVTQVRARARDRAQAQAQAQQVNPMQGPGPRFRNPLANNDGRYLNVRGPAQNQLPRAASAPTARADAPSAGSMTLGQALNLNAELHTANLHEWNYQRNIVHMAEGTPLRREYDEAISHIRARASQIRTTLGLDALSWFHF